MFTQPQDFHDETEALYTLIAPLDAPALAQATAFKGWTIADIIAHLHVWNWGADLSLTDPARFDAMFGEVAAMLAEGGTLRDFERRRLDGLGGRALVETWRAFAATMTARFAAADPRRG